MPATAADRAGTVAQYVRGLEYRKELARLLAKRLAAGVPIVDLVSNPDSVTASAIAALIEDLRKRDLFRQTAEEAYGHLETLGIDYKVDSAGLDAIASRAIDTVTAEAGALLTARAADLQRSVARMIAGGVSTETIAKSLEADAGGAAALAQFASGLTQTAAGLISAIDGAVTREALTFDNLASQFRSVGESRFRSLGAMAAEDIEASVPLYTWETREDDKVCEDIFENSCAPRHGEELTLDEWDALGQPGGENLICSMFAKGAFSNCRCKLIRADNVGEGVFPEPADLADAVEAGKADAQLALDQEEAGMIPSAIKSARETGVARLTEGISIPEPGGTGIQPETLSQISHLAVPSESSATLTMLPSAQPGPISSATAITSPIQPTSLSSAEEYLKLAREGSPLLKSTLEDLQASIPGAHYDPYNNPRVKENGTRLAEKLLTKRPDQISDYLGGRIFADSPEALDAIVADLRARFNIPDANVDSFLVDGKIVTLGGESVPGGYRALHLQATLPNGLSVEIQIVPSQVAEIKDFWHDSVYTPWRGRTDLTVAEKDLLRASVKIQDESFRAAIEAWEKGIPRPITPLSAHELEILAEPWKFSPGEFITAELHQGENIWRSEEGFRIASGESRAIKAVKWGEKIYTSPRSMPGVPVESYGQPIHADIFGKYGIPFEEGISGYLLPDGQFIYMDALESHGIAVRYALTHGLPVEPKWVAAYLGEEFPAIRLKAGGYVIGEPADTIGILMKQRDLTEAEIASTGLFRAGKYVPAGGEIDVSSFAVRRAGEEIGSPVVSSLTQPGRAYRGMTSEEFNATIGAGKGIASTNRYSLPGEGTSFAAEADSAESYVNFGRDDPRITGKPTYLVEVESGALTPNPQGYLYARGEVPRNRITRIWKMEAKDGAIVATLIFP